MNNTYRVFCYDGRRWHLDQVFAGEPLAQHWAAMRRRAGRPARVEGPRPLVVVDPVEPPKAKRKRKKPAGNGRGGFNRDKLRCRNGHNYSPENTRYTNRASGKRDRVCRICAAANQERSRRRRRLRAAVA